MERIKLHCSCWQWDLRLITEYLKTFNRRSYSIFLHSFSQTDKSLLDLIYLSTAGQVLKPISAFIEWVIVCSLDELLKKDLLQVSVFCSFSTSVASLRYIKRKNLSLHWMDLFTNPNTNTFRFNSSQKVWLIVSMFQYFRMNSFEKKSLNQKFSRVVYIRAWLSDGRVGEHIHTVLWWVRYPNLPVSQ